MTLKKFLMVGFMAAVLVACSDDGSSNSVTNSDEDSSSSVAYVKPCRTDSVDLCEYGSLTDERDGKIYKTVEIGTQTWMAENLNYAYTGVPYKIRMIYNVDYTSDSSSWCYKDSVENCIKYGRLYTWAAAMDSVGIWSKNGKDCGYCSICRPTYPVRGICPEGWHLPTSAEWDTLFTVVGGSSIAGKMLKSTNGWRSFGYELDDYAFSALPAGSVRFYSGKVYDGEGVYAPFWSSTENDADLAYRVNMLYYDYDYADIASDYKHEGLSVRCIKDNSTSVCEDCDGSSSSSSVIASDAKQSSDAKSSSSTDITGSEQGRNEPVESSENSSSSSTVNSSSSETGESGTKLRLQV